jgi:hypothetical protein
MMIKDGVCNAAFGRRYWVRCDGIRQNIRVRSHFRKDRRDRRSKILDYLV